MYGSSSSLIIVEPRTNLVGGIAHVVELRSVAIGITIRYTQSFWTAVGSEEPNAPAVAGNNKLVKAKSV
jgi:hypothetical protein